MRQIKFRAWRKSSKTMLSWHDLNQLIPGKLIDALNGIYLESVMQYTGLKDRNGKEIYEGDIVTSVNWNYFKADGNLDKQTCLSYRRTLEVRFIQGNCQFMRVKTGCGLIDEYNNSDVLFNSTDREQLSVLGNIYENPELLNSLSS